MHNLQTITYAFQLRTVLSNFLGHEKMQLFAQNAQVPNIMNYLFHYTQRRRLGGSGYHISPHRTWMDDVISSAFTWYQTPQGQDFWETLHVQHQKYIHNLVANHIIKPYDI